MAGLRVSIDDLAGCVRDPQHRARLEGSATCPGLATALPLHDGELQLYVPDAPIHAGGPDGPLWRGAGVLVFRLRDLPAFFLSMRAVATSHLQGLRRFLGFARRELATQARA